jgi:hypothetical protein
MTDRLRRRFGLAAAPILLSLALSSAGGSAPAQPPAEKRYARLHYTMTKEGAIELQEAQVLESEYVADVGLLGDFVYALEGRKGAVLAVGSFPDPLIVHSHRPERPHQVLVAESGEFHVSLPGSVLKAGLLNSARLVFYRSNGSLPSSDLTLATMPSFREGLRKIYVVEGKELARQLLR